MKMTIQGCGRKVISKKSWGGGNYGRTYKDADKSLARPTSRCILFDGYNYFV
jgi:hypothetical protein